MAGLTTEPKPSSLGLAILARVGIGVGAATILVIVIGFFLPRTFSVERSIVIDAAPAHIHGWLDDLHRWSEWTPWLKEDPSLVVTVGEVSAGAGASQTWTGDSGGGWLRLTRSEPDWGVAYEMAFAGDKYPSTGGLLFGRDDAGARVTWTMTGDLGWNPFERYPGLLLGSLIGPMFDEGLAKLRMLAETADEAATDTTATTP